jgi:hypothetical protein
LIDLAGAFAGEFVFDIAIFAMTLYKAMTLPRGDFGLLTMIMRDGMYNWQFTSVAMWLRT